MLSIKDIEELNSKLLSVKAKEREEGLKLLGSYLDTSNASNFYQLLDQQTFSHLHHDRMLSSSWPGVLQSLCESVELEIKLSKKRGPKAMLMKVIRTFFKALRKCGRMSFLQRSMKKLFRHVSDVLMETPSFVSIYSYFLRNLLEVAEYRLSMSRKIYTNLLSFYLGKVRDSALTSEDVALSAGDEDVNNAWTLHYLLKYPPGDFTDQMRGCIVTALCEIFPLIRDGWKPVKRLLAALNSFLENDGPNLGDYVIDIHRSINDFLSRTWLTTLDSDLKEALVVYARMQLILRKIIGSDEGIYIGQFLELVEKDLDKKAGASSGVHRFDGGKLGAVSKSMQYFLELAATLIYEDGVTIGPKNTVQVKKQKREHIFVAIMDRLGKGKILWDGAFCLLIRCHFSGIEKPILVDWLDCLTRNLDRILGEAVSTRAFEASLWTLRCLEELSAVWKLNSFENNSTWKVHCSNDQVKGLWQSVWSSVIHWLPSFCAVQVMTEAAFKLLGHIVAQGLLPLYAVQNDFWDLSCFSEVSVRSILFFVAGLFSTPADKIDVGECMEIRKKLMKRMMPAAYLQASVQKSSLLCSGNHLMLISAALLSLSTGFVPFSLGAAEEFCGGKTHLCSLVKALDDWAQPDEVDKNLGENLEVELEELDLSKLYFASFRVKEGKKGLFGQTNENSLLPFSVSHILLHELAEDLLTEISFNVQNCQPQSSIQFFNMSALLLICFSGVSQLLQRRGREHETWSTEGRIWQGLLSILQSCISWVKNILTSFDDLQKENSTATFYQNLSESMIPAETTVRGLQSGCLSVVPLKSSGCLGNADSYTVLLNDLLLSCSKVLKRARDLHEFAKMSSDHLISLSDEYSTSLSDLGSNRKLVDSELDVEIEKDLSHIGGMDDSGESSSYVITDSGGVSSSYQQWRLKMARMIGSFAGQLPTQTCDVLVDLLAVVNDSKVQGEILLQLCRSLTYHSKKHVPNVVKEVCQSFKANGFESDRHHTLNLVNAFLTAVLGIEKSSCHEKRSGSNEKADHWKPAEKELEQLVKLVLEVAETGLMLWSSRRLLADVISKFILIDPDVSQNLIDKFLVLLHDPEYQVRLFLAKQVNILFQTWTGHDELFVDVCSNFGSSMVMATRKKLVTVSEISSTRKNMLPFSETSIVALGELAAYSEKIEEEAVFMMCSQAAIHTNLRPLVCVTFDKLARKLKYPNRWKYLGIMLGAILSRWVKVGLPLPLLVEIREILAWKLEPVEFLQHCCPLLLPSLFLAEAEKDLMWLGEVASESVMTLVRQHFASVFAAILPLYCVGDVLETQKAVAILQGSMLAKAEMTEDERDKLIKKHMVSIVNFIFQFCSSAENPQLPFFPQSIIIPAIRIVVEGFVDSDVSSEDQPIIDKMHIFRQDRIFLFILHLHFQIETAYNPRHLRHTLARLACLISVARQRIASPSIFRYLLHVIFQIMEWKELQIECCQMVGKILDILNALPEETKCCVLGVQLQFIISKLVGHCINAHEAGSDSNTHSFLSLIERLTLNADSCLYNFVKELTSFPDLMYFEHLRSFHEKLKPEMTVADEFVKLVSKASDMSHHLQLWSLKNLREKFDAYEIPDQLSKDSIYKGWNFSGNVVSAAWKLIQFCFEKNTTIDMCDISGDFISKVGIGDPYAVVFHLPDQDGIEAFSLLSSFKGWVRNVIVDMDIGVSEELVKNIILQLQRYLFDESVHIIELAFQTLKGILSTEKGNRAFLLLDDNERDYLDLFSRRVNQKFVESFLSISRINFNEKSLQIADNSLWQTCEKSHDMWVCTLVSSLIHYSEDIILRLCQGLVSCKALLAEIILPHVLGDLAGRYGADSDICRSISSQVEKHIFCSRNNNTRSIQLFLDAINELRHCFVHARKKAPVESTRKRESTKGGLSKHITSADTERLKSPQQEQTISKFEKRQCIRTAWSKVFWLEIDYLIVAKAAQKCGAYFTSLLYVEHWCEEKFGALTLGEPDFSNNEELSDHLELLLTICTRINEPDSIYGVMRSQKLISQILTSEHERNWTRAVESYDLLLRSGNLFSNSTLKGDSNPENFMPGELCTSRHSIMQTDRTHLHWSYHKGMINSLQQSGFSHVLETYCKGLAADKVDIQKDVEFLELQYEAAWRAGKWDFRSSLSKESRNTSTNNTFHSNLHSCLRSLHEGDGEHFLSRLKFAKQELLDSLAHTSLESTQNVYPSILKLQILNTLSKAWGIRWEEIHKPASILNTASQDQPYTKLCGPHIPSKEEVSYIDADWKHMLQPMACQYDLLEPYMAFRRVLLDALECRELKPWHLLEFTTLSRKAGRLNQASMAMHEMKLIYSSRTGQRGGIDTESGKENFVPTAARIEEAKILWAQGQHEMAVNLVKYIIQHHDNGVDLARLHCLTGKWLAENRSASSRIILEQYLKKAVELAGNENGSHSKLRNGKCQTYYRLAHYADSLYRSYEERLNSSEWQAALRLRQHKAKELESLIKRLKSGGKNDKLDYAAKAYELQKLLTMDNEEAQQLQDDRDSFLRIALDAYSNCLTSGQKYDLRVVFRITSLWFNLSSSQTVVAAMLKAVKQVQSFKFLPLVYQIASRLGSSKDMTGPQSFQYALSFLLKKMATEHPYHTLFQLLALANGDRVKDKQRNKNAFVADLDKKQAAEDILKSIGPKYKQLIHQMKQMVEIYIKLAELEVKREDMNKRIPLPRDVRSIRRLELVPVVTASISVDPSCAYPEGWFPYFKGFSDRIVAMNGVNMPKDIECLGSDGKKYRQVAKSGNDDLRQDAVMEQLFGLVNTLLQEHPDTRKRCLNIRTYKVVPFTPSAGVIEWVSGTVTLGDYLVGSTRSGGAHGQYGHGDWSYLRCREYMVNETDKRDAFQKVLDNFRPVMHNFFLENFAQPAEWFEKRLAYTRSVATSSMVGYIVGLGDRHSNNILIDQSNAELVHIDLGVAFEQGLVLKTPERVPFRLTRDVIDGMGVSGVEGVFRRCCEETLAVMRSNKEALLTIIEVFIHDPLYKWALSPLKALQRQKETNDIVEVASESHSESSEEIEGNKDAARALFRVKQKLDGYEGGDMRSIQGQVQQLIQDAQDPEKLCQMFPGWGSWL